MSKIEELKELAQKLITLAIGVSASLDRLDKAGELDAIPTETKSKVDELVTLAYAVRRNPPVVSRPHLNYGVRNGNWCLRELVRLERDGILKLARERIKLLEPEIYEQKKNGLEHAFEAWKLVRSIHDDEGAKERRATFEMLLKAAEEASVALRTRRVLRPVRTSAVSHHDAAREARRLSRLEAAPKKGPSPAAYKGERRKEARAS